MKKNISVFAILALVILLNGCLTYGAGGLINNHDNSHEIGAYLFGSTRYTETTISYGLNEKNQENLLGVGLSLRYSFSLMGMSVYPLLNVEYQNILNKQTNDLGWVRFGGGMDYWILSNMYVRGVLLYAPSMFIIDNDGISKYQNDVIQTNMVAGFTCRLALGYRPKSSFSLANILPFKGKQPANTPPAQTPSPTNRDGWDIRNLDTARNVNYLSDLEKDVILELNMARSDPKKYAQMYLNPNKSAAAKEAYDELMRSSSLAVLQPRRGLSQAAKDHVLDTGPKGITGHTGSDGSTLSQRANRHGTWRTGISENCSYGMSTARDINIQLLESSGHRANIMNGNSRVVGVATGPHRQYSQMCVQKFAVDYVDK